MKKNNSVAIILCYGHLNEKKDKVEIEGKESYLDEILNDVSRKNINNVVLSGGYSDKRFINSESQSYISHLKNKYSGINFFPENVSINHSEHVTFSLLMMRKFIDTSNKINIYCAHNFFTKTKVIAYGLLHNIIPYNVIPIEYSDNSPNNNVDIQTLEKLPQEINSEKFILLKQLLKISFNN